MIRKERALVAKNRKACGLHKEQLTSVKQRINYLETTEQEEKEEAKNLFLGRGLNSPHAWVSLFLSFPKLFLSFARRSVSICIASCVDVGVRCRS